MLNQRYLTDNEIFAYDREPAQDSGTHHHSTAFPTLDLHDGASRAPSSERRTSSL
jgi:hypothetical protein